GVDVEVERRQGRASALHVRVGDQQIRAEVDQPSYRVRLVLQDRPIHLVGRDPLPARRTERSVRQAERFGALLGWQQLRPRDVGGRDGGELNVSAWGVE